MKIEREKLYHPKCSWLNNPARGQKISAKDETHDNIDDKVDEDVLYKPDKIVIDKNKWRKRVLERKLKNTYDIKIPNVMNCIHEKKVDKIAKWNLLYDILNPSKRTKF